MRVYKLFSNAVGSTFATVSVQIVAKGTIVMVDWAAMILSAAAASSGMAWELSQASNLQFQTNDAQDTISNIVVSSMFGTAVGLGALYANKSVAMNLPVAVGSRLWLNTNLIGTAPTYTNCAVCVHVK